MIPGKIKVFLATHLKNNSIKSVNSFNIWFEICYLGLPEELFFFNQYPLTLYQYLYPLGLLL